MGRERRGEVGRRVKRRSWEEREEERLGGQRGGEVGRRERRRDREEREKRKIMKGGRRERE